MVTTWYYAAGNRQIGPISEAELDSLVATGKVQRNTLVWREGLSGWIAYESARPLEPVQSAPSLSEAVDGSAPVRFCTECGQPRPEREMVSLGARTICVNCKDRFTQQLREQGVAGTRFQYAGFWIRGLARVIDGIILNIVILPMTFMLGMGAFTPDAGLSPTFWMLQLLALGFAVVYETFFVFRYGATPGKMVVGKKIIMADGSPLTLGRSFARYLSTIISSFTLCIGYIMAAFDDEKRALHDRICDTRVIAK